MLYTMFLRTSCVILRCDWEKVDPVGNYEIEGNQKIAPPVLNSSTPKILLVIHLTIAIQFFW